MQHVQADGLFHDCETQPVGFLDHYLTRDSIENPMIGRVGAQDTLHDGEDIGVGTLCHATFTMENGLSTIRFMCLLGRHHSSKQRDGLDVTIQPTSVG